MQIIYIYFEVYYKMLKNIKTSKIIEGYKMQQQKYSDFLIHISIADAAHRVRTEGEAAPQSALETKFGFEAAGSHTNSFRVRAKMESFLGVYIPHIFLRFFAFATPL